MTTKTPEQIALDYTGSMGDQDAAGRTWIRNTIAAAIAADRAQRAEQPAYKVGDPDPTPDEWEASEQCESSEGGYMCTWHAGHSGQPHVAGDSQIIVAVWP